MLAVRGLVIRYTYDTPALCLIAYLFYCILIALSPLSDLDIYHFWAPIHRTFYPSILLFNMKICRSRNALTLPFFQSGFLSITII